MIDLENQRSSSCKPYRKPCRGSSNTTQRWMGFQQLESYRELARRGRYSKYPNPTHPARTTVPTTWRTTEKHRNRLGRRTDAETNSRLSTISTTTTTLSTTLSTKSTLPAIPTTAVSTTPTTWLEPSRRGRSAGSASPIQPEIHHRRANRFPHQTPMGWHSPHNSRPRSSLESTHRWR